MSDERRQLERSRTVGNSSSPTCSKPRDFAIESSINEKRKHHQVGRGGGRGGRAGREREEEEQTQDYHHHRRQAAGNQNSTAAGSAEAPNPSSSRARSTTTSPQGRSQSPKAATRSASASTSGRTTKSGGKDRHSKVNTARGPRDRRVRLSVSTAIQFYDIQDRLGFDQPSKAIEWLLKKAKPAIDELNQLAPLTIGSTATAAATSAAAAAASTAGKEDNSSSPATTTATTTTTSTEALYPYHFQREQASPALAQEHGHVQTHHDSGAEEVKAKEERLELELDDHRHHQHHQELASFLAPAPAQGSVFDVYSGSGSSSTIPMRSSFTQLLQSPFPASLFHSSPTSQNLHLFNSLYSSLPPPPPPPAFSLQQPFQHQGLEIFEAVPSLHSFQSPAAPQTSSGGMIGHQQHHGSIGQHWTSSSSGMITPMLQVYPHTRGSHGSFSSLDMNQMVPRHHQRREQHHVDHNMEFSAIGSRPPPSGNLSPLYMVPARIQGLDEDDDEEHEHDLDQRRRQSRESEN